MIRLILILLPFLVLTALPSDVFAATGPSFKCDVNTGYARRNSTITMTAAAATPEEVANKDVWPNEKVYVLTGELPDLESPEIGPQQDFATVDDTLIPKKQRYAIQPLRLACLGATANPYLVQCEAIDGQHVVLKGMSDGISYDFGDGPSHEFNITDSIRRSVTTNDEIGEVTSRQINIVFRGSLMTHQLVRYTSNRGASPSDCKILP